MDWCKMFSLTINCETGEVIERPYTAEELAEAEENQAEALAEIQAKAEAAAKRQALLDKLGITEDEAKLLLGGN
jgi:hypothetical protein